jgi:hypothetical protein
MSDDAKCTCGPMRPCPLHEGSDFDDLMADAASLVDFLNTCLREAGADAHQLPRVDLVGAKRALATLIDAERLRAAANALPAAQTEALLAELKARGAVAVVWVDGDETERREEL